MIEPPLINIEDLTVSYGRFKAIHQLSTTLPNHGFTALIGPNGAGKSTLIKAMMGLLNLDSGSIKYQGEYIFRNGKRLNSFSTYRKHVSYVPEHASFYDHLTPREYLKLIGHLLNTDPTSLNSRIEILINDFHIERWADRLIQELSKGNRQRLSIMTAFMPETTKLLILDEPLNGLDPGGKKFLLNYLKRYTTEGLKELDLSPGTVLLSSHNLSDIDQFYENVIIINKTGDLVYDGSMELQTEDNNLEELYLSTVEDWWQE